MKKYINTFWITVTIVMCIIFAVLFAPIAINKLGTFWGILATTAGIMVILFVYVIRAIIFTQWKREKTE